MRNNSSIKIGLIIGIAILFIFSAITPMTFGTNIENLKEQPAIEADIFDSYHVSEKLDYKSYPGLAIACYNKNKFSDKIQTENLITLEKNIQSLTNPPMDSPWPMYCHDVRHTGRSPYSTADNTFYDKWWYRSTDYIEGSGAIDKGGVLYFCSDEGDAFSDLNFVAIYPNGTLTWKCKIDWFVSSSPVIADDGTIYIGDRNYAWGKLYSISPNGTLNWKLHTYGEIYSSPAISSDGTIYVGDGDYYINAINPNGTFKWRYKTGLVVYSSPAIGLDGTVYCGSHDTYLYAFYPNNGTVKWKYKLEDWVRTSPCIGDDGTIYVASLYLHALYPNGTLKWKTNLGGSTSPTIGQDGTIYAGLFDLYALNPENGSIKWVYATPGTIQDGTPCNAADGSIFFGTHDPGYIIGLNMDGSERFRKHIGINCDFAPIIGEDGTIYIGTSVMEEDYPGAFGRYGYLYAFNNLDPDAPSAPDINGPNEGNIKTEYIYTFKSTSPQGRDLYYYIDWGDYDWNIMRWIGPYNSDEEVSLGHTWSREGTYIIKVRAKDSENLWGPWSEFEVSMPRNKATSNVLFLRFLEQFPILKEVLLRLIPR